MESIVKPFYRKFTDYALLAVIALAFFLAMVLYVVFDAPKTGVVLMLGAGGLGVYLVGRHERKEMRGRFAGREAIPLGEQLAVLADEVDVIAAEKLWREIAVTLKPYDIPAEVLRLDDRFDRKLDIVQGCAMDSHIADINDLLWRKIDKHKLSINLAEIHTLGDILRGFCKKANDDELYLDIEIAD